VRCAWSRWCAANCYKLGSLLKAQVQVRTWTPWDKQGVGFLEIDLVAHCGISNHATHWARGIDWEALLAADDAASSSDDAAQNR
jgi:hypothetical protein